MNISTNNSGRRRTLADPEDSGAKINELMKRARIEGKAVYLELLNDRQIWNRCTHTIQDQAIAVLSERLRGPFEHRETRIFIGPGAQSQAHRIAVFRHRGSGLVFHLIPGGEFTMGSENEQADERPVHTATVKAFLLGRAPVRRSIWDRTRELEKAQGDLAQEFICWLSAQRWLADFDHGLRLPTEAEWEYACRAGTNTRYFWGDHFDPSFCWSHKNTDWELNRPVVTRHFAEERWNNFGLVDMCGTIWEWCEDHWKNNYDDGPYTEEARRAEGYRHVLRGGSWYNHGECCRSGYRISHSDDFNLDHLGLRVARSLDEHGL